MGHYDDAREAYYADAWRKELEQDRHRIIPRLRKLANAMGVLGIQGGSDINKAIDHLKYVAGYEEK